MLNKNSLLNVLKLYINSNVNELQSIIYDLVADPMRVLGFIEEINSKLWVLQGENIALYPTNYHKIKFHLMIYDHILL